MMDNERKHSEDVYDSEEEGAQLFPRHGEVNLKTALEILGEYYKPDRHWLQLVNCCYRCPHPHMAQAYLDFKHKFHPQLKQPKISNLYGNQQFVDMLTLVRSKEDSSLFYPDPKIDPIPPELGHLLGQLFEKYGYVPHFERFLLYYPTYLAKHRSVEVDLFESGKVESKAAYFVAMSGAAEMGSVYMMNRYLKLYLKSGGQTEWFTQQHFPTKLGMLRTINRFMARAPWEINAEMIEEILQNQQVHWSRNQLAIYVQILAFAHQNSIIALSVGLLPEQESFLQHFHMIDMLKTKEKYDSVVYESEAAKEKLASIIPVLDQCIEENGGVDHTQQFKKELIESKKSIKKSAKKIETVDSYMKEINIELTKQEMYRQINHCVHPLIQPFQVIEKRGGEPSKNTVIDYSEYNYKFMAYPILNSLTHETADKIEAMIDYSEIMTRGNVDINQSKTKEFRKAVRYYAQNLCGYTHMEYDFKNNVSAGLTMALKFYVRLVMMSPLHISRQVLRVTNHESGRIECFDLGHLAVLVANTKMSLELMSAVQAFEL